MLTFLALTLSAQAAPGFIPVQGVLTDSTGTAIDGSVDVTFRLTTDATGATSIWTDTLTIDVISGRFATELGANLPLDLDTFSNYPGVHLGVTVAGDSEMPLVPLDHVPYAAAADHAATLGGLSLAEIRGEIPQASDIEALAQGVCFDSTAELTGALDATYAYTAGTGINLSNLEFSADQSTVEGWAGSLITTHSADAAAHHVAYTDADADARAAAAVTTHTADAAAHHAAYTDADADARAAAAVTTHTADAAAHHVAYTDTDADARAAAAITTHTADAAAHHVAYTDADAIAAMDGGTIDIGAGALAFAGGTAPALPTNWELGMASSDNALIYGAHVTGTETSTLFITTGDNAGSDNVFIGGGAICCTGTPFLGLRVQSNGNAQLSGTLATSQGALYADLAENVPADAGTEAGDVVVVPRDTRTYGDQPFARSSRAYDPAVVGVITDSAVMTMAKEEGRQPLALSGLVKVKVDAGYGAIQPGDLLTSSPTTGHAMRADEDIPGTIIGKALEPLEAGTGRVLMLVMPR